MWTPATASLRLRSLLDRIKSGPGPLAASEPTSVDPCMGGDYSSLYLRMWKVWHGSRENAGSFWMPLEDTPGAMPVPLPRQSCVLWLGSLHYITPVNVGDLHSNLGLDLIGVMRETDGLPSIGTVFPLLEQLRTRPRA